MLPFNKLGTRPGEFEEIIVGEEFGPETYVVDDHMVKAFAFAQDDLDPWTFSNNNPFGKRTAQAACLANDLLWIFMTVFDPNTVIGLHTQEELWFHRPAYVGETVAVTGRYVDKYQKRGKGCCDLVAEVRGEDNSLIMEHCGVEIMRVLGAQIEEKKAAPIEGDKVTGKYDETIPEVSVASSNLEIGTPLAPLVKQTTNAQTMVFSNCEKFFRSIHADIDVAKKTGYDGLVVQGQQQVCYIIEMMRYFFGINWFTSGYLKVKMVKPVIAGEKLTFRAVIKNETIENGRTKLHLHVWGRDTKGDLTTIGWTSAFAD